MTEAVDPKLFREAKPLAATGSREFVESLAWLSESLVAREPEDIPTWVTANLFMPAEKTTRGGPIVLTPIQAAIARFWQTPGVEQVTFLKPPRIGSSFINGAGLLYYACHEAQDVIFYERSEQTAQEFNNDKLMPILRNSVSVASLIRPDSKAGEQDRWTDRMLMNGAGLKLRSVSNQGAFRGIRGRFIVADEAGSPEYLASGKRSEGSKIDSIKSRGQEFADFVLYMGGTPTRLSECTVSAEYAKSDKREFVMTAPCCGERQAFRPDVRQALQRGESYGPGLRYTLDDRGVPDDVWYECAGCGERIEETSKVDMMATGVFEATTIGDRGHVGVYAWSIHSTDPRSTWRHIAEKHQASEKDPTTRQTFVNLWLAQPFEDVPISTMKADDLAENVLDLGGFDVPDDTVFCVQAIDNQDNGRNGITRGEATIFAIRANQRIHVASHRSIDHVERVTVHGEVKRIQFDPFSEEYADEVHASIDRELTSPSGKKFRIKATFVDCGWQTELAYAFCTNPESKRRGIVPIRGDVTERGAKRVTLLPAGANLRKAKSSGRSYLWIGTRDGKDEVARRLSLPVPAPGSITFAPDLPESYFESLTAESLVKNDRGLEVWTRTKASNTGEAWDTAVYGYAASRYVVMKNRRLRNAVDMIDPAEAEKALIAKAEAEASGPANDDAPAAPSPDTAFHAAEVADDNPEPLTPGQRFRVVQRKVRREPERNADGVSERVRRVRARKTGLGW